MKKLLILSIIVGTAFAATVSAQTFRATARPKQKVAPPPPITERPVEGVIPRAFRGGNPFQMLNPKAPAKYGTAAQSVILDPDTGKWRGIKLFEIVW